MENKIYCTYRPAYFNHWEGQYTPSQIIGQQFSDYEGLIEVKDNEINEVNYTYKNANWLANKTRFLSYGYVTWIDYDWLIANIKDIASFNNIVIFNSVEEARQWVRDRTDLEEVEEGKFLIQKAGEFPEETEDKYLIID